MALAVEADRLFQLALPDEAPRSNYIGHDIYLQWLVTHPVSQWLLAAC